MNVTVLLHNLLHRGLISQHLCDHISALFQDLMTNDQFQDFWTFQGLIFQTPKIKTFQNRWEPWEYIQRRGANHGGQNKQKCIKVMVLITRHKKKQ